jgi:hypothetical protein
MLFHLRQGDVSKTEACKKKVEILQIQNSPRQYFEGMHLYLEAVAYSYSDDLLSLKRTIDGIKDIADRFEGWMPFLHYALGEYHRIRGEFALAIDEHESALSLTTAGHHAAWPYAAAAHVHCLRENGLIEEAQIKARAYLVQAQNETLGFGCNYIRIALAPVEAILGATTEAIALSEAAIDEWTRIGSTGLNLGLAYESRARIALIMGDAEAFVAYAKLCAEQYKDKHNPALTAKYGNLLQEARQKGFDIAALDEEDRIDGQMDTSQVTYFEVKQRLNACDSPEDRAKQALAILQESSETKGGYLFGLGKSGLNILSSTYVQPASDALVRYARAYLEAELYDTSEVTVTEADERAAEDRGTDLISEGGMTFAPIVLYGTKHNRLVVTGLALLSKTDAEGSAINAQVIQAISETLLEKGDVVSRAVAL